MSLLRKAAAVLTALGIIVSCAAPACAMTFFQGNTPLHLRVDALEEMIEEIQENYKDETDLDQLFTGIYKGLFESLNDPWSAYYEAGESDDVYFVTNNVEEPYEGIGVTLRSSETQGLWIVSVVSGSPAQDAGLRTGDVILKIGTVDAQQLNAKEAGELIRGTAGSVVSLTIDRDGEVKIFDIHRTLVRTDSVSGELRDDGIACLRITSFAGGSADAFAALYDGFAAQGARGVVLDLRANPGGSIDEACAVADHLIHSRHIISIFERQGAVIETVYSDADAYADLPVVCLVDGETASASELLAGALQDSGEAIIAGEQTYGKGVAQFIGAGMHDDVFRLSVFYFLTPSGSRIDGVGIRPDVTVRQSGGLSEEDAAALRARLAPMNEAKKYYAGDTGLNVYAAQQRLAVLGYEVEATGVMDARTIEALKAVQAEAGACPYGGLDYCTLGIITDRFDEFCSPRTQDAAFAKAIELLKE